MGTPLPYSLAARVAIALLLSIAAASGIHADDGDPDPRFNEDGIATRRWPLGTTSASTQAGAVAPDGSVIAAGAIFTQNVPQRGITLVRWLPDGSPDPGFGDNGAVRLDMDPDPSLNEQVDAVFPRANGSLLALVNIRLPGTMASGPMLLSLRPDGTPDETYGPGGLRPIDVLAIGQDYGGVAQVDAATMQPDGRILLAGRLETDDSRLLLIARVLPDASLDPSFSENGWRSLGTGGGYDWRASAITVDDVGRILVVARAEDTSSSFAPAIFRLFDNGGTDRDFGTTQNGRVIVDGLVGSWSARAVVADERLVAGSFVLRRIFVAIDSSSPRRTQILALANDGTIATSFGTAGFVDLTREEGSRIDALAMLDDDRLVAAGFIDPTGGGNNTDVFVARMNFGGDLDPSFDGNGVARYQIEPGGPSLETVAALALSAQRPVVVADVSEIATSRYYAAALRLRTPGEVFVDGFED